MGRTDRPFNSLGNKKVKRAGLKTVPVGVKGRGGGRGWGMGNKKHRGKQPTGECPGNQTDTILKNGVHKTGGTQTGKKGLKPGKNPSQVYKITG